MPKNNAQEQIIAKLKESESILIALNDNPSVDELSNALALTIAINKSGKHATAVATGQMPDALAFLQPEKTFENSVDSLRDFIIALNKEKADHLRYKLVGDYVKIFITPYQSVISEKDLEFEQGDFNIDFVLALGVNDQNHLDGALASHGRIFHDASVGILTVGENSSDLEGINWHNEDASSLSEMSIKIIESLDKKSLLEPVATALLTGIVAETDRFSNSKATADIMSLAATLISAGADQQLVISKIREAEEKAGEFSVQKNSKMENALEEISAKKEEIQKENSEEKSSSKTAQKRDGAFVIAHEEEKEKQKKSDAAIAVATGVVAGAITGVAANAISEKMTDEDKLEKSLNEVNNKEAQPNAFEELKEEDNNDIFEDMSDPISEEEVKKPQAEVTEPVTEVPAQEQITEEDISTPVTPVSSTSIIAEPAPAVEATQPQPAEVQNIAPVVAQSTPVDNLMQIPAPEYIPEIPAPTVPFDNQNAFISEAPTETQSFEPAPQVEIAPVQYEPQNAPDKVDNTPAPIQQSDEYYHPRENADLVQNLANYQPEISQNQITSLQHNPNEAAVSNPEDNNYVLSRNGSVSNEEHRAETVSQAEDANINFIPETVAYAQSPAVQPLSSFENNPQNEITAYQAQAPQAENTIQQYQNPTPDNYQQNQSVNNFNTPDFNNLPVPPAVPDFSSLPMPPELPPLPNFDFNSAPQQQNTPALGAENSGNIVMTDQIYPSDPSQFKIPGM